MDNICLQKIAREYLINRLVALSLSQTTRKRTRKMFIFIFTLPLFFCGLFTTYSIHLSWHAEIVKNDYANIQRAQV